MYLYCQFTSVLSGRFASILLGNSDNKALGSVLQEQKYLHWEKSESWHAFRFNTSIPEYSNSWTSALLLPALLQALLSAIYIYTYIHIYVYIYIYMYMSIYIYVYVYRRT